MGDTIGHTSAHIPPLWRVEPICERIIHTSSCERSRCDDALHAAHGGGGLELSTAQNHCGVRFQGGRCVVHWILSGGAAVHGGNLISLERAREASSRAVSAHLSGGGGCSLGSGLAKHHCRLGRTQLSRRRRLGQCVGCSSWSRSSCVHHSALYRSCVPDRCKIYVSSCLCIVARSIGKIVTMRHKIFKHFWHAAPRPSRTLLGLASHVVPKRPSRGPRWSPCAFSAWWLLASRALSMDPTPERPFMN